MRVDVLIVGGGLAGSLAAWRLAERPDRPRLRLIERSDRLGGNHTWSCHATDLDPGTETWLAPLVSARWDSHEVCFPDGRRILTGAYLSLTADRLREVIGHALAGAITCGVAVVRVDAGGVTLESGERIDATLVLDARGGIPPGLPLGWQTFVGRELELAGPHDLERPIIMDATVEQAGGFRFIYVLPFSPSSVLVEDTVYADVPEIDHAAAVQAIDRYVAGRGWRVARVVREETGALPIPLGGSAEAFWSGPVTRIGVRAGLFHPTTGYSLPDAVRVAELLAGMDLADASGVYDRVREMAIATWRRRGYFRLLNRLLFRAARPEERRRVMAHFYRLPEPLIARFYAGRLSWVDRVRILAGRPPVPVARALAQVRAR